MDAFDTRGMSKLAPITVPACAIGPDACDKHKEVVLTMMAASSCSPRRLPDRRDAENDVDVMIASLGLQLIRRYVDQHHWGQESRLAHAADTIEPGLKLENVAAHSWHVADITMLLASAFPDIDGRRALELAVVHDKLEMFTGDLDPTGVDGQGATSHAFDPIAQAAKTSFELSALETYLGGLRPSIRATQRALFAEIIDGRSNEARFVKAVDKLQALTFVVTKKAGAMSDEHLAFSLRYSAKAIEYFPRLAIHHAVLVKRLLMSVAEHRRMRADEIIEQLPLPLRTLASTTAP